MDPAAGKGRDTNRLSCKWLGRPRFTCNFEAAKNHLLEYLSVDFAILDFADGINVFKSSNMIIIVEVLSTHESVE